MQILSERAFVHKQWPPVGFHLCQANARINARRVWMEKGVVNNMPPSSDYVHHLDYVRIDVHIEYELVCTAIML